MKYEWGVPIKAACGRLALPGTHVLLKDWGKEPEVVVVVAAVVVVCVQLCTQIPKQISLK